MPRREREREAGERENIFCHRCETWRRKIADASDGTRVFDAQPRIKAYWLVFSGDPKTFARFSAPDTAQPGALRNINELPSYPPMARAKWSKAATAGLFRRVTYPETGLLNRPILCSNIRFFLSSFPAATRFDTRIFSRCIAPPTTFDITRRIFVERTNLKPLE